MTGVTHRGQQIADRGAIGLDQQDVGPRGNGVGPLHVQRDFRGPARVRRGQVRGAARLAHLREYRIGQAERLIELVQVAGDVGIVVGIDDGDGRAAAVAGHRPVVEGDVVEAVGRADLRRRIARGARRRQRR